MLLAALRRFASVFAIALAGATLLGLAIAAVGHDGIRRGLAIGFYVSGCGLGALALFLGIRPPVRARSGEAGFMGLGRWGGGSVRWADREEHRQAMNMPALLLTLGVMLILIGVGVDDRH